MEMIKEEDDALRRLNVCMGGGALKTGDNSDSRVMGSDMIERVVGLSCVEMCVFRLIVCFL